MGAEALRLLLLGDFASVSHGVKVPTAYDTAGGCYQWGVKLRTGLVVGFAFGYYFGAKAGRERYEQLRRLLDRAPVDKMRAAVDLGRERLREINTTPTLGGVMPPSAN